MRYNALLTGISVLLTACTSIRAPTPVGVSTETPTAVPTVEPSPTATPVLPVMAGTAMPGLHTAISAENADQIVEIARWGRGNLGAIAYSTDGTRIIAGTSTGWFVFDASSFEELARIDTDAAVTSLSLSPDGDLVACGLASGQIATYQLAGGELVSRLDGHVEPVRSLVYSPDGRLLASGSADGSVKLWDLVGASEPRKLVGDGYSLVFSRDGSSIFVTDGQGSRRIDVETGRVMQTYGIYGSLALSADQKILAGEYIQRDKRIRLLNVETGEVLGSIDASSSGNIAFSPNGSLLAAPLVCNRATTIWRIPELAEVGTFRQDESLDEVARAEPDFFPLGGWPQSDVCPFMFADPGQIAFSPDGAELLIAAGKLQSLRSSFLRVLRTSDASLDREVENVFSASIHDLAFSSTRGSLVYVEGGTGITEGAEPAGRIRERSILTGLDLLENGVPSFSHAVVAAADGDLIAVMQGSSLSRWEPGAAQPGSPLLSLESGQFVHSLGLSPDGSTLAVSTSGSSSVVLLSTESGDVVQEVKIEAPTGGASISPAFSPHGGYLLVDERASQFLGGRAYPPAVHIYDLNEDHDEVLRNSSLGAISPDGQLMGVWNGTDLQILRFPSLEPVSAVEGFVTDYQMLAPRAAFSADGSLLVSGSVSGALLPLRVEDSTPLPVIQAHNGRILDLLFVTDGSLLVSSSEDGTIRFWGIRP